MVGLVRVALDLQRWTGEEGVVAAHRVIHAQVSTAVRSVLDTCAAEKNEAMSVRLDGVLLEEAGSAARKEGK